MQAKDIPERPVLEFLAALTGFNSATWYPGYDDSVTNAMPPGTPEKVALAKMRALINRKLVEGCGCGCRGSFTLTEAGRKRLSEPDAISENTALHSAESA